MGLGERRASFQSALRMNTYAFSTSL